MAERDDGEKEDLSTLEALIDLKQYDTVEQFLEIDDDLLKKELGRLGLKVGGKKIERAQRLYDIKVDPSKLFHPKYLAKKSKI